MGSGRCLLILRSGVLNASGEQRKQPIPDVLSLTSRGFTALSGFVIGPPPSDSTPLPFHRINEQRPDVSPSRNLK